MMLDFIKNNGACCKWRKEIVRNGQKTTKINICVANGRAKRYNCKQESPQSGRFPKNAAIAAEGAMFTTMALINILLVNIILVLDLAILAQGKNSVFGHAESRAVSEV